MVFAMTPFTLAQTFPLQEPLQELSCPCMLRIVNNFLWGSLLNNYATVDKDHTVSRFTRERYFVSHNYHR